MRKRSRIPRLSKDEFIESNTAPRYNDDVTSIAKSFYLLVANSSRIFFKNAATHGGAGGKKIGANCPLTNCHFKVRAKKKNLTPEPASPAGESALKVTFPGGLMFLKLIYFRSKCW
jgi:hypothetical protein